MGPTYRSVRTVNCWKVRTCGFCDCSYRYFTHGTRPGFGATPEEAVDNATAKVVAYLQTYRDRNPCPHCGRYQVEMIGASRMTWHAMVMMADVLLVLPWLGVVSGMPRWLGMTSMLALIVFLVLAHVGVQLLIPNFRAPSNRKRATHMIQDGNVQTDAGSGKEPHEWKTPSAVQTGKPFWLLAFLTLGSLVALPACDVLRLVAGWPADSRWHPEVVSPGDRAWVFLPRQVHPVKGLWNGQADATLETQDALGVFNPISARTQQNRWGDQIKLDRGESTRPTKLWVEIQVPNDPAFAGKKVRIHMSLIATFPALAPNGNEFLVQQDAVQHSEDLHIAPAGAGAIFSNAWNIGLFLPSLPLFLFQCLCVWQSFRLRNAVSSMKVVPFQRNRGEGVAEDWEAPPKFRGETSFRSDGDGSRFTRDEPPGGPAPLQ